MFVQLSAGLPLQEATAGDNFTLDDEALARQAQGGDAQAFAALVDRYQRGLVNLAYRLVGNWETALDLAQDTFVRAYQALNSFDSSRRFSPWLYRIATNRCYDYLRQQRRRQAVSLEEVKGEAWNIDESSNPVQQAEQHDLAQAIEEAIAGLPPRYRTVVVLRYLEGMSYQDIAETLEMPLGTAKTHIYRARVSLRQTLSQKGIVP